MGRSVRADQVRLFDTPGLELDHDVIDLGATRRHAPLTSLEAGYDMVCDFAVIPLPGRRRALMALPIRDRRSLAGWAAPQLRLTPSIFYIW
ncbi:hypothetical protein Aros01_03733 [Streptosporangium roseum]|uniref:Uncharacterized protein n=1 Tax=Streptosporangium roseum (strain ATCC 12428 / DSM 43021 / JCM 3005 / KCTC 9067 / NCIMB 10171 / NRRL 2505 / NI 9100) TaxID=479432 RepID=D2B8G6_STRRD|nr:hypothetical protein Sros_4976 [Streptosporangium roseum DSM 43021]